MSCPKCGAESESAATDCQRCGIIFAKWEEVRRRARQAAEAAKLSPAPDPAPAPAADEALTPRQAVIVPAVVFAIAVFLNMTNWGHFAVYFGLSNQLHELGHACAYWIGGGLAIPYPEITYMFLRWRPLALLPAAALSWLLHLSWKEDCPLFGAACAAALLLEGWIMLFASDSSYYFLATFAGLAGEIVFSSLLVVLYFHRLPAVARWPKTRLFFLAVGTLVLASSVKIWTAASRNFINVPWGSFFNVGDGVGDVGKMIDQFHWTVNAMVKTYLRMSWLGVLAAAAAYGTALWRERDYLRRLARIPRA